MRPVNPALLQRIQAEYLEMPGLALTPAQASRLWSLSSDDTDALIETLVLIGFLARTSSGSYVRTGRPRRPPVDAGPVARSGEIR